ncbi:MAG TPA: hypothetical protein VF612_16770 [Jatrophihabitans sp.]|jgi:hypothetical protein|uniref:hypothetical protein n=1 Tax=Jatrophihabitans sp. TaxID=1932789 RepID=UPI002EF0C6B5
MSDVEGTAGDGSGAVMNRRALLRASGVAAGIAGIAAALAPSADAATGDPVLAGASNDGGASPTTLTANTWQPTLILDNAGTGVPLRLAAHPAPEFADSGDLMNIDGDLCFAHGDYWVGSVYTSLSASQLIPVRPFRAVDTRTTAGRANILNRSGNLDSAGRLIGGHTIEIDLGNEVFQGAAVYANVTVTQPVSSGYLTVWPSGTRPGTSTLNYLAGQVVANSCVSGLSSTDTLRVYAQRTTHVLLDVVAFAAGIWSDVRRAPEPPPIVPVEDLAGPARKAPAWRSRRS